MGNHNGILHGCNIRGRKICYIFPDPVGPKRFHDRFLIHQRSSGKIQDDHTVLHLCNGRRTDHSLCALHQRDMNRNIITFPVDIIYIRNVFDVSGKVPCGIHRNIGIVSVHFHAQRRCCIGHQDPDGTKSDHSKFLSHNLIARKCLLLLLRKLRQLLILTFRAYPVKAADNVSGCQKHPCQHQLLDSVGIGARSIENSDSLLGTFPKGNVVDTCSGSSDHTYTFRKFHVVHCCTPHQHRVRIRDIIRPGIIAVKILQSNLRDGIQTMILIHSFNCSPLRIFS